MYVCERDSVCVCERIEKKRECVCASNIHVVCICVCERKRESVYVCEIVCVWERERA